MSEWRGLRGRLTLALAGSCAVVVALVGLLVLVPLHDKLRQDALRSLTDTARAVKPDLARLHPGEQERLIDAVRALRRRAAADVLILDGSGRLLASTDQEPAGNVDRARDATATHSIRTSLSGNEAEVALPYTAHGQRRVLVLRRGLRAVDSAQDVVARSLIAAAIVALAIGVAIGGLLAGGMVRRLRRLRSAALDVAAGRETAVDVGGHDEIADVARAFGQMQGQIVAQETARRRFVATASHELRTPLTSLGLMLEGAVEDLDGADVPAARDQLVRAHGQADRLSALAADLLDLSRVDAGVELRAEPVDLGRLVHAVAGEFAAPAPVVEGTAWVTADPGSVARIVRILIDNGRRHGAGTVSVAIEPGRVTVTDDGSGVAAEDVALVFERFHRGGASGFGLGLAIGRELARMMHGDLVLEAPGPNPRFVLTLPD